MAFKLNIKPKCLGKNHRPPAECDSFQGTSSDHRLCWRPIINKIFFRPAVPLLISLICGILLGTDFAGHEIWAAAAAIVCAGGALILVFRQKTVFFFPVLLFVSLGYLSIQPWISPRLPANHIVHYTDTRRWDITGRIVTQPQRKNHRSRFHLQVISIGGNGRTHLVAGKLRVTAVGDLPDLIPGDVIRFNSRMRSIANFRNPGGFDFKRYMAFKSILATAYLDGSKLVVLEKHPAGGFSAFVTSVRNTFAGLIEKSGSTQAQGVFKALIIGDRSGISAETRQAFNRAGVGHLLAISGLHIGIVAAVAFGIFNYLLTMSNALLWRAWTRKGAALLSLLPVLAYGVMAGLSPSTQRALIMISIFLLTFLFEREQDPFNTLGLAALVILIADPPSLYSLSFQLSFAAVLAIIYGFSRLQNRAAEKNARVRTNWRLRLADRLAAFFLASLFAVCGSLPLVAFYFNQISLVGLAANFVVVPLVGFVVIPLGLAALFMLPLSTTLAFWFIKTGIGILAYTLDAVQFFADLPFAAIAIFTPSLLEIGCYYGVCWALLNLYRNPLNKDSAAARFAAASETEPVSNNSAPLASGNNTDPGRLRKIFRWRSLRIILQSNPAITILVLVLIVLAADTCYWMYERFWHTDLRITVIDVGHGNSSLLEFPGGYTMLIDGGGFSDNSAFDVGKSIVAPFLNRKKIRTVDTLLLTHPDSDHLNGLIYIAGHFHVKRVWTNNEAPKSPGYKKFKKVIAKRKILLPAYSDLQRTQRINGVALKFLYPLRDFLKRAKKEKWRNHNNNSLVVKVSLGSTSFLFPGDVMKAAEKELVAVAGSELNSTVLMVPHHGSRSSNSDAFLTEVNPDVAVVSCSRRNRFNLPNPKVLAKYQKHGCSVFRTDTNGAVCLSTDGQHLEIAPVVF